MCSCNKESNTPTPPVQPVGYLDEIDLGAVYNGNLIVAGYFYTILGSSKIISQWNGSSWSQMDNNELNSSVNALILYNGSLIAGGYFNNVAGIPGYSPNYIAEWNGAKWGSLDSGTGSSYPGEGVINTLQVYNGNLIAGGQFTQAGGSPDSLIAQWNGIKWLSLSGLGLHSEITSLAIYNGNLIAGGQFTEAGGNPANNIAQWNGTAWQPLGLGITGSNYPIISGLTVYNGNLIVTGTFTQAGGTSANNIAQWNGTTWSALGSLSNYRISSVIYNGNLIISGDSNIAQWNGVGSPVIFGKCARNPTQQHACFMNALCIYNGNLIVGGCFSSVNGINAKCIAQWNGSTWSAL